MKTKKAVIMAVFLLIFIVNSSAVSAGIGIARDYLPGDTLELHAGESETYSIRLQNTGDSEVETTFQVKGPEEIVTLLNAKESYTIPANSNKPLYLKITIPDEVEVGTEYKVNLYLGSAEAGSGTGQVSLKTGAGSSFKIRVIPPEENSTEIARVAGYKEPLYIPLYIWIILVLLAIASIVGFLYYKTIRVD
ncbi:MAG: hypothetical protein R6U26_02945 [Candidatus Undinarchaeales archaeon]